MDPKGRVWIWTPHQAVLCTLAEGRVSTEFAQAILDAANRLIGGGQVPLSLFHHWKQVLSYQPEVRSRFVAWGLKNLRHCEGFHFLVGSGMLAMGVSVASLVVPRVHAYRDEPAFLSALNRRIEAQRA